MALAAAARPAPQPPSNSMGFLKEFRDFAMRGNVVDLAVGVIIGAAFGKITESLVKDILMPPLGYIMGGADFSDRVLELVPAQPHPLTEKMMDAVVIRYGSMINVLINFIIVAFAMFVVIKAMNATKKKAPPPPPPAPKEPSNEEKLLKEIRDLLAKKA
jgi:large conductance mechanosensitive channel